MAKVISKDGTQIAYEKSGDGPALILVDGAICYRSFGPMQELSKLLSPNFTVFIYDRRGRGESSNGMPFAIEREVEDIDALIKEAGEPVFIFGISSGACLALEAAVRLGTKIKKLAMYEPPYNSEPSARQHWKEYRKDLAEKLSAGQRGEAVVLFMSYVGNPAEQIEGMKHAPVWPMFEAIAPTLAYDAAAIGDDGSVPSGQAAKVSVPTLVMSGTALPFMLNTATELAKAIPQAQQRTLEGQSHDVDLKVLAPRLVEFFKG
jgi:pimeloyl-ACP methyl ester carboxylesterase